MRTGTGARNGSSLLAGEASNKDPDGRPDAKDTLPDAEEEQGRKRRDSHGEECCGVFCGFLDREAHTCTRVAGAVDKDVAPKDSANIDRALCACIARRLDESELKRLCRSRALDHRKKRCVVDALCRDLLCRKARPDDVLRAKRKRVGCNAQDDKKRT